MLSNFRTLSCRRLWGRLAASCTACIVAGWLAQPVLAQGVRAETVATGLDHPWAVAFLPQGRFLVTERPGRMRIVGAQGALGAPLAGVPEVVARGQGGLHDVVTDSDFAANRTIYFCYAEPGTGGNSTALARARLSADERRLEDVRVIFSQRPKVASTAHFGCRIVEARDGTLFLTLGERFVRKEDAQTLDNHLGKVVRVQKDGRRPQGQPIRWAGRRLAGNLELRPPQRAGRHARPDGTLWMHEHGAQGGDEINLPQPGRNYGWPVITYGENYGGGKIGEGLTQKAGMEQPLHYWVPSIAPSGMAFLTSDRYGADWKGSLFVGSLKFGYLARLPIAGGKVGREEKAAGRRGPRARRATGPGRLSLPAHRRRRRQAGARGALGLHQALAAPRSA
jgi:glucose/arabinose dehydrogenase